MDVQRFEHLVARLEQESVSSPTAYRAKVAALTLLGFVILALLFGAVGAGLLVLVGIALALVFSGGSAWILLLKLGKLLILLAIPLWFLVKWGVQALFIRLPAPQGRAITRAEAPQLFAALDRMRQQMRGPRFHQVLLDDNVNAAVSQRPAWGLVGWPRNYLVLGLPLLESMPPEEALAVVAHEYGHLAGSHGRFSAYVYRLRHTWGTVQMYTDHIQGWLGPVVAPVVRWYAPYFNAYTFVLARADEYQADAASAQLVGAANAAHALKRVNVVASQHQRFMERTFDRIPHEATPPGDLMHCWAAEVERPLHSTDAERWLGMALDREGHFTDSHPTLRARLAALAATGQVAQEPPPPVQGGSAAQAWLGPLAASLRAEFQSRWANAVSASWAERHAQAQQQRVRLDALSKQDKRSSEEEMERLQLIMRLGYEQDLRDAWAAFNATHADHALGLLLEGSVRLDKGDAQGLALLDRASALDPEATKAASQRAYGFLLEHKQIEQAKVYAERWHARDRLETLRAAQLQNLEADDELQPHGLPEDTVSAIAARFSGAFREHIAEVHLARRLIPCDPACVQWVMAVKLTWWGARSGKWRLVLRRLSAMEWAVPLIFVTLDGRFKPWAKKVRMLADARLV